MSPDPEPLTIACFDTDAGLKRLGGKRERYESVLRKFAAKQVHAVAAIREALLNNDIETAERVAHSLKGSASTIGANLLAEAAAVAENAIKSNHGIDEALRSLSDALDKNVAAIRAALPG